MNPKRLMFLLILLVFVAMIFPTLLTNINTVDPSTWTFTGHAEAYLFLQATPYIMAAVAIFLGLVFVTGGKED